MRKIVLIILLIVALIMSMIPAFAAEKANIDAANYRYALKTKAEEEHPGILPTSPFYFLKELGRGVKRVFTQNPIAKAEFEFEVASQKAAELRKLKEIMPKDSKALKTAVENYSEDLIQFNDYIESIDNNPKDNRLNSLFVRIEKETVSQNSFLEELKSDHGSIKKNVEDAQAKLNQTLEKFSTKFKIKEE